MKRRMTRERLRAKVKTLYGEVEADQVLELADQIWKLADVELCLREVHDARNTRTIPYTLGRRGKTKRIFRLGFEARTGDDERLAIDFPFWTWEPWTEDLQGLRDDLLGAARERRLTRLDKGGATEDIRLELKKSSLDTLVNAIRTVYRGVERNP